ncbi:MAG: hypothetical protein WBD95_06045 [Xanthobacteraceae bacterium]
MLPERDDRYYRSEEETVFAIAEALHEEYRAIIDAGFILQVDDACLASWCDMMLPNGTLADYRKWVGARIAADHQNPGLRPRGGECAPRTRMMCMGEHRAAGGRHLVQGVVSHHTNLIEHPRLASG